MALPKKVREDENVMVLTEHPDRIRPRDLSNSLLSRYKQNQFKISLRRNIYVIYVDRRAESNHINSNPKNGFANSDKNVTITSVFPDFEQRLEDVKLAEEVLREGIRC